LFPLHTFFYPFPVINSFRAMSECKSIQGNGLGSSLPKIYEKLFL
jgi:hypothetical protein